jgi:hypothetical protein
MSEEREKFEDEWDQDGLAGHAEGTVTVAQCKEIAWDLWQSRAAQDRQQELEQATPPDVEPTIEHLQGALAELAHQFALLRIERDELKQETDLIVKALVYQVYQAGGMVSIRKETLEQIPHVTLYATETSEGQLVMRIVRTTVTTPS